MNTENHGNNRSDGNNWSHGNNCSYGNNRSDGNNWSHGNNCSYGNNHSDGNNRSDGNNWSHGNNCSDGNNRSDGNNWSHGNNCSDGNNWSHGNNRSDGNSKVLGSHKSLYCYDKKGICFMAFNQQGTEKQIDALASKLKSALDGWLPYVTNYQEMLKLGWHKEHKEGNAYVTEHGTEDETCEKMYHAAWSRCPRKKIEAFVKVVRETEWLDIPAALEVFRKVTGLDVNAPVPASLSGKTVTVELDGRKYEAVIK